MKIFVHYEPSEAGKLVGAVEVHTMKAGLPKSWYSGPVLKVKQLFMEAYEKKHGAKMVDAQWRLMAADGKLLDDNAVVETVIQPGADLRMRCISSSESSGSGANAPDEVDPTLLQCRNYGCNKKYREGENGPEACAHHTAPPCFNDVRKWWGCCSSRVAYDWEEFMHIGGCSKGAHSTTPPAVSVAPSPRVAAAAAEAAGGPVAIPKSIDAFNASNPEAVTAASSVARTLTTRPVATQRADGAYRCVNKGCAQQWFQAGENGPAACVHHSGQPVFHDAVKSWSCCPGTEAWSFDEFMAIPGCIRGEHDPGDTNGTKQVA